jgi:hypothetical protein
MSVVVNRDAARGQIVARLRGMAQDAPLQARGRFFVQLAGDRVVAVTVADDGTWSATILADLIAQQLGVHRDEAIQAVLEAGLTG